MNATRSTAIAHQVNTSGSGSDTDADSNPEDVESTEYYQPIDGREDSHSDSDTEIGFIQVSADGAEHVSYFLANGFAAEAARGISSIRIDDDSEEEEEEVEAAVISDAEIVRALSEDERRRSAPLPADTATRVMEAMRSVSFAGVAPDWAVQVPEDQWIHQLRRITHFPSN